MCPYGYTYVYVCVKNDEPNLIREGSIQAQFGKRRKKRGNICWVTLCARDTTISFSLCLYSFLTRILWGREYYHHLRDKEPESQWCEMICSKSHNSCTEKLNSTQPDYTVQALPNKPHCLSETPLISHLTLGTTVLTRNGALVSSSRGGT